MGVPARSNHELYSSYFYKFYTSLAADIDLIAESKGGAAGTSYGKEGFCCRRIMPFTSGNLVVKRPDGASVTITNIVAYVALDIQAIAIVAAGTTVTAAMVYW